MNKDDLQTRMRQRGHISIKMHHHHAMIRSALSCAVPFPPRLFSIVFAFFKLDIRLLSLAPQLPGSDRDLPPALSRASGCS